MSLRLSFLSFFGPPGILKTRPSPLPVNADVQDIEARHDFDRAAGLPHDPNFRGYYPDPSLGTGRKNNA